MSQHPTKFDVHHHFVPDFYVEALEANGGDPSGWTIPKWTLESSETLMENIGIGTTIFSMTAPGPSIHKDPSEAASLARKTNTFAAAVRDSNPQKFGFFAALPSLLNKESAISEIRYAIDELKADGVTLFTRYGPDNHYLGHPDFQEIWQELNDRSAVVFVHPTHGVDTNLVAPSLPQPMIDYPHETTRTAMDIILSGTVRKYKNCKIILSHAGGTLPYLALRVAAMMPHTPFGKSNGLSTDEIIEDAKSFYFDLALSGNEFTLGLLLKFAKPGHILFGSDFPYAPTKGIEYFTESFDKYELSEEERSTINRGNAEALFPRFQAAQ
ncbi:hypothetical protein TWF569_011644 [Orbilia oligospora]|uniref:6-methylsalicylate decarboxylase n=1 Tax=Orbilia oligospora TaxID=2813651 RepID=A0A7C8NAG4_ORBOL|nr:hypothetical protein TWF102_007441 [Orbilia oligospora]KAF3102879.1 hypothetical protein TWF103_007580 [Orbilia oligospora]KAF3113071.1 hypothetical protein TWF706_010073 [Orbilia oligospora]KAF3120065.1 hypothetical protein TWF703_002907 [Orbilia oligospora]KAF3127029.1 hypothetical protein TWF594_000803 [Orbilia oligospora]